MLELALQLSLMALEAALAAGVLLALFSARAVLGLAPIYTTVGVFYYLATLLAGTTFIKVGGLLMSPGSVALFPASLFAVLLVYIREDAQEARNMIYGLLAANVSASLLGLLVSQHLQGPLAFNPLSLPPELFVQSPRLFIVGLFALFADTILIILVYEAISRFVRPLFLRIWLSLALVLVFDTLLFVTGGFVEHPAYSEILLSGVLGKVAAAMVYTAALALYLPRVRAVEPPTVGGVRPGIGDLFQVLTYRQKYEALQAQASRDPVTGVHNRGFFDDVLRVQLAAARRGGAPVAVLLVDVDHFKRINDTYGHSEGDRALRVIAQALARAARASDIVCRYGGEEFCLILPGTPPVSALLLAGRIREEVPAACAREGVGGGARVTVTIGLASSPADGVETDAIMRVADERLYRGKNEGRDRVVAG
jgi:diguanylate cyclase (GGDEF)-like protein